jgi:hypothetical protein
MARPVIPDRRTAVGAGLAFIVLGAWLLSDAYESRGHPRPFWFRFLPGG